jgi:hypothetical protein
LEVISMPSRFYAGAAALAIILAAGHTLAAASDPRFTPAGKAQKVGGGAKSAASRPTPLGATVESVLAVGRRLNPALRAAALDTATAASKAAGADALDDPMISDSYQYCRNPNVFSGHSIMVTQAFPRSSRSPLTMPKGAAILARRKRDFRSSPRQSLAIYWRQSPSGRRPSPGCPIFLARKKVCRQGSRISFAKISSRGRRGQSAKTR